MRNASEILQPLTRKLGERGAHFLNHTGSDRRFHCLVEVWRAGGNRPWVKPPRFVQFLLKFGSPVSVSSFSVLPWGNFQRLSMAGFNHFINSSFKRAQVSAAKDVFSSCSNDRSPLFRFRCQSSAFHLFRLSPRSLKDSLPGLLALKQRLLPQGCRRLPRLHGHRALFSRLVSPVCRTPVASPALSPMHCPLLLDSVP